MVGHFSLIVYNIKTQVFCRDPYSELIPRLNLLKIIELLISEKANPIF